MRYMTSAEIREEFLSFFEEHRHKRVASSSLVPGNDPTLLFTNAGMVQFKDVFLGIEKRDYVRATTAQKVMRVSGKHNDLENVGPSNRHHTFFEMLGNFSFGDYFKREACQFAYQLITQAYGLPPERLFYTVHHDDKEAFDIWVNVVGVPADHVCKLGDKDNFWMMADTGPCGYTSEIHWDNQPELGAAAAQASFDADDGRFLEFWNLVFMQFEAQADGTRVPLPKTGVDTGLGLERIVSIIQQKPNNYDTDLFMPIIRATQEMTGHSDAEREANIVPYRVIADHLRAASFLIADGVRPGTQGRDYVCRMILRRAMRFGKKLPFVTPTFLAKLSEVVVNAMGEAYPELKAQRDTIYRTIALEEKRFLHTMDRGLNELESMLAGLDTGELLSAGQAFYLHSTLGLPIEVTRDVAQEHGFGVDEAGFKRELEKHTEVSKRGSLFGEIDVEAAYTHLKERLQAEGIESVAQKIYGENEVYGAFELRTKLLALLHNGKPLEAASVGERVEVVLDQTPFYVESGGQVSDSGTIAGEGWLIDVEDVRKPVGGLIVQIGEVIEGTVPARAENVVAQIDARRRLAVMRNHTATHLLHTALRNRLGTHVQQRGSLVAEDRLRFDFSHDEALTFDELNDVQREVNLAILQGLEVQARWKDLNTARAEGAMALFGEKYGERVRTITITGDNGRYSYELCGGTHLPNTAIIGTFIITQETAIAQGIRRIEAVTGIHAYTLLAQRLHTVRSLAQQIQSTPEMLLDRVMSLQAQLKQQEREIADLRRKLARSEFSDLMVRHVEEYNGARVLVTQVTTTDNDTLRMMADWFREAVPSGVVVLGMIADTGKPQLLAAVTKDLTRRVHAGNLIREVAQVVGGSGGGRDNLAQAGGKDAGKLAEALMRASQLVAQALNDA
jgi:alanyl-tRNA synthetase